MAPQVLRKGVRLGRLLLLRLLLRRLLCCRVLWRRGGSFEPPCRQRHAGGCLPSACVNTFIAESIPRPVVINVLILLAGADCRNSRLFNPASHRRCPAVSLQLTTISW
jgi:hypothetical protein